MKVENGARSLEISGNTQKINQKEQDGTKRGEEKQNGKVKAKNGSINAAELTLFDDEIANKKQKAAKEAMDFIKNQFKADSKIDDALDATRERSAASKSAVKEAQSELNAINEEKEKLKEEYGEDSEIYKEQAEMYAKQEEEYRERIENAHEDIAFQSRLIRNTKQELLKYHGMVDASKAAEETLENAGKEIIGMLVEESKDNIDKDMEETIKEAQDKKEDSQATLEKEQKEKKKKAEDVEEKGEEKHKESMQSSGKPRMSSDELLKAAQAAQGEINAAVDKILSQEALIPDDIKGAMVDTLL